MTSTGEKIYALNRQIEDLKLQLAESRETLQASRGGANSAIEQPYRMVVENMSEGAVTLAPDGAISYCNPQMAAILKMPLSKIIAMPISAFIVADYLPAFESVIQRASLATATGQAEIELKSAAGLRIPVLISARSIIEANVRLICLIVTDLSAQKRTAQIIASEKFTRTLLDQAADAIMVCDIEGTVIRSSNKAQDVFGLNPEGWHFDQLFSPFNAVSLETGKHSAKTHSKPVCLASVFKREIPPGSEITLPSAGQNPRSFILNFSPITVETGLLGYSVSLTEITERKKAENALNRTQRTLEEAQRIAHFGIFEWNIITGELRWSSELFSIFGEKPDSFVPEISAFLEFVHLEDRGTMEKFNDRLISTGTNADVDFRIVLKNSSIRYLHATAEVTAFDEDGKPAKIIGTVQDITAQKQADQVKDEFIGMVSHELKTPITIIMGALHTASDQRATTEQVRELMGDALRHTEILTNLVDNLLELSRQQSDRLVLKTQSVDIGDVSQQVLRKLVGKTSLHIFTESIPAEVPPVLADPFRVERILYNLVDNAVKYSPNGGEVQISARRDGDNILVGVRDHGIGISIENQSKLFQSFERLGMRVDGSIQGTGLGLRVCRILVEAHHGKIWVESTKGQGSTFYFTLPAAVHQTPPAPTR